MTAALVRQRIRQSAGVDHPLLNENLTKRATHFAAKGIRPAGISHFFGLQVVEIPTDTGYLISQEEDNSGHCRCR
jgi:hypothetical protein